MEERKITAQDPLISSTPFDDVFRTLVNKCSNLLFLIPFYIFNFEKQFTKMEQNLDKLETLQNEFLRIRHRLDQLSAEEKMSAFDKGMIADMTERVIVNLTQKHEVVQERMRKIMVGKIIENEWTRTYDAGQARGEKIGEARGEARGIAIGEEKKQLENIQNLMKNKNWTAREAMDALGIPENKQWGYASQLQKSG